MTVTEQEIHILAAYGRKVKLEAIAETQGVSPKTVESVLYRYDVYGNQPAAKQLAAELRQHPDLIITTTATSITDSESTIEPATEPATEPTADTTPTPPVTPPPTIDELLAAAETSPYAVSIANQIRTLTAQLAETLADAAGVAGELAAYRDAVSVRIDELKVQLSLIEVLGTDSDIAEWATDMGHSVPPSPHTVRAYMAVHEIVR